MSGGSPMCWAPAILICNWTGSESVVALRDRWASTEMSARAAMLPRRNISAAMAL